MVTLVSAPGLLVFLVARSSFLTWATASIIPLNKRALSRIRFISDVRSCLQGVYNARGDRPPRFTSEHRMLRRPEDVLVVRLPPRKEWRWMAFADDFGHLVKW